MLKVHLYCKQEYFVRNDYISKGLVKNIPESIAVVVWGGAGVAGGGGDVQSAPEGWVVLSLPKARFRARKRGNGSTQHLKISIKLHIYIVRLVFS